MPSVSQNITDAERLRHEEFLAHRHASAVNQQAALYQYYQQQLLLQNQIPSVLQVGPYSFPALTHGSISYRAQNPTENQTAPQSAQSAQSFVTTQAQVYNTAESSGPVQDTHNQAQIQQHSDTIHRSALNDISNVQNTQQASLPEIKCTIFYTEEQAREEANSKAKEFALVYSEEEDSYVCQAATCEIECTAFVKVSKLRKNSFQVSLVSTHSGHESQTTNSTRESKEVLYKKLFKESEQDDNCSLLEKLFKDCSSNEDAVAKCLSALPSDVQDFFVAHPDSLSLECKMTSKKEQKKCKGIFKGIFLNKSDCLFVGNEFHNHPPPPRCEVHPEFKNESTKKGGLGKGSKAADKSAIQSKAQVTRAEVETIIEEKVNPKFNRLMAEFSKLANFLKVGKRKSESPKSDSDSSRSTFNKSPQKKKPLLDKISDESAPAAGQNSGAPPEETEATTADEDVIEVLDGDVIELNDSDEAVQRKVASDSDSVSQLSINPLGQSESDLSTKPSEPDKNHEKVPVNPKDSQAPNVENQKKHHDESDISQDETEGDQRNSTLNNDQFLLDKKNQMSSKEVRKYLTAMQKLIEQSKYGEAMTLARNLEENLPDLPLPKENVDYDHFGTCRSTERMLKSCNEGKNYLQLLRPLQNSANGSCLFKSVMQAIYGSESGYLLLRLKAGVNLFINQRAIMDFAKTQKWWAMHQGYDNLANMFDWTAWSDQIHAEAICRVLPIQIDLRMVRCPQIGLADEVADFYSAKFGNENSEIKLNILWTGLAKKLRDFRFNHFACSVPKKRTEGQIYHRDYSREERQSDSETDLENDGFQSDTEEPKIISEDDDDDDDDDVLLDQIRASQSPKRVLRDVYAPVQDLSTDDVAIDALIKSVRKGHFKPLQYKDIVHLSAGVKEIVQEIPQGIKTNTIHVVCNKYNNDIRILKAEGVRPAASIPQAKYEDDLGAYGRRRLNYFVFIRIEGTRYFKYLREVSFSDGVVCESKGKPLEPQPDKENIIVIKVYKTPHVTKQFMKKTVEFIQCPNDMQHLYERMYVEYCGDTKGCQVPHGNSLYNERPYIRTGKEIIAKGKAMAKMGVKANKIHETLLNPKDITKTIRDAVQSRNIVASVEREKRLHQPMRNLADEINAAEKMCRTHSKWVHVVQRNSRNKVMIMMYDKNFLLDIAMTSVGTKKVCLCVDRTFEMSSCYATMISYRYFWWMC